MWNTSKPPLPPWPAKRVEKSHPLPGQQAAEQRKLHHLSAGNISDMTGSFESNLSMMTEKMGKVWLSLLAENGKTAMSSGNAELNMNKKTWAE